MKRIYWRPQGISRNALLVIASSALAAMVVVEVFPERTSEAYVHQMLEASRLARGAMDVLRQERLKRKIPIDPVADPTGSGLIGVSISDVTSDTGNLLAKQTTINPNWAAVAVEMLKQAGVQEGDTVAVGVSGSFPAINVCLLAAMTTLRLNPIVIASASASQWGANHPRFLWIDMERALLRRKVFPVQSVAVSLGGAEDRALGMSEEGVRLLEKAMGRTKLPVIRPENYAESVVERMAIYRKHAKNAPIRAYINVGGSTSSVGTRRAKFEFRPGLNFRAPPKAALIDSVMARFLDQGIPVIHFLQINRMATRYGLPLQPAQMPPVGTGEVFLQRRYNPWLASAALVAVIGSLFLFIRSGRGRMALKSTSPRGEDQLEPTL
jgi:poly-gamma-glutamate system protein